MLFVSCGYSCHSDPVSNIFGCELHESFGGQHNHLPLVYSGSSDTRLLDTIIDKCEYLPEQRHRTAFCYMGRHSLGHLHK